ncbi:unnamed protein product, partial [Acanthocheilonema viteae]
MKSYHSLLLSNHTLRIFFLLYTIIRTINAIQAKNIHDTTIGIDKFGNRNSENDDTGNYHQSVSTITKNGVSEKVDELVTDEDFILNTFKQRQRQQQQQNENEKSVNNGRNFNNVIVTSTNNTTDSKRKLFAKTNFTDFSLIYSANNAVNKKLSLAINPISNNSKFFSSLINQSNHINSISSNNNNNIQWKNLNRKRNNFNDRNNDRKKRWAMKNDDDKMSGMDELIERLTPTNYNSPTIASDEISTLSDYHIDNDRFRIPMENIVIVGSDADDDNDDDVDIVDNGNIGSSSNIGNNDIFKGTTYDDAEITDSYEQMNSVEENGNDENTEMGIVRIAPEMLPKDSVEEMDKQYETKLKPTIHYLESRTDEMKKSNEIMEMEKIDGKQLDELENLKEIMDEKLLKIDMSQTKKHLLQDEVDLGTIQEMRISDDPNDAAIACDDETEGSGLQGEGEGELQEY